ncbi:hypothetical protein HAX54_053139, partial [Datura stramonium]|nr:hypothetical protein [Datura stramonium]
MSSLIRRSYVEIVETTSCKIQGKIDPYGQSDPFPDPDHSESLSATGSSLCNAQNLHIHHIHLGLSIKPRILPMLKIACLPSRPLEKLVTRKEARRKRSCLGKLII